MICILPIFQTCTFGVRPIMYTFRCERGMTMIRKWISVILFIALYLVPAKYVFGADIKFSAYDTLPLRSAVYANDAAIVLKIKAHNTSDTPVFLNGIAIWFSGSGNYTSRQIRENYIYLDKNGNGKMNWRDPELTGGFNYVRPNKIVRFLFKKPVLLKQGGQRYFIFETKFGDLLQHKKTYSFVFTGDYLSSKVWHKAKTSKIKGSIFSH